METKSLHPFYTRPYRIIFKSGFKVFICARSTEQAYLSAKELWPQQNIARITFEGQW